MDYLLSVVEYNCIINGKQLIKITNRWYMNCCWGLRSTIHVHASWCVERLLTHMISAMMDSKMMKKQLMTAIKTKSYSAEPCLRKSPHMYVLSDTSKF